MPAIIIPKFPIKGKKYSEEISFPCKLPFRYTLQFILSSKLSDITRLTEVISS